MIEARVEVDLRGLKRFSAEVDKPQGPIRAAFRQWEHRYSTFVQRRFRAYSRGGGDWPPLKNPRRRPRDKRARSRRRSKGRGDSILYDTGTLFRALDPTWSRPGALREDLPFGVRLGYGGPHRYARGGAASIADIASFHDQGTSRLPRRRIIVEPDASTLRSMAGDMQRALNKLARGV